MIWFPYELFHRIKLPATRQYTEAKRSVKEHVPSAKRQK
jgi:hypothetical protein